MLVKYNAQTSGPLTRGWVPAGLSHEDFSTTVDNEALTGYLVADYNGDPSTLADYGLTEYTPEEKPITPVLQLVDPVMTINGTLYPTPLDGRYYLPPDSDISFVASINGGDAINIPMLKLVAERQVDDVPSGEEFYFTGSIVDGVLTVEGNFPISSNYKITAERNNRAIDRMFSPNQAQFHLSFNTLDFLS